MMMNIGIDSSAKELSLPKKISGISSSDVAAIRSATACCCASSCATTAAINFSVNSAIRSYTFIVTLLVSPADFDFHRVTVNEPQSPPWATDSPC
jgi:hypothetical protein